MSDQQQDADIKALSDEWAASCGVPLWRLRQTSGT